MKCTFQEIIKKICDELDITYISLSKDWVIMLKKNDKIRFIFGYKFDLNQHGLGLICDDKYAMYNVLKENNIKVIEHNIVYGIGNENSYALSCNNLNYLKELFEKYNEDIVLKINNGTCGINVEHITNLSVLEQKFLKMGTKNNSMSLCPYYEIDFETRVIILNDQIKLIYKKERPIVFGDGHSTIKELLLNFNPTYFGNIDNAEFNKVLDVNEKYIYDWKFNLSRGARMSEDIDELDKNKVIELAKNVIKNLNLKFCSIDIIKSAGEYYVLEINSGVMMKNYIEQAKNGYSIAYNIYKDAILEMFNDYEK